MTRVALDARITSHMSAGMVAYVRALLTWLPRVAPDLPLVTVGRGDNFDLAEQVELPWALGRSGAQLAHLPTPFVPLLTPIPYVVTVHDLIDLAYPQFAKPKVGPYFRALVGPVLRRARAVITDDGATVADLERYLRVDPARVAVIPLGVDDPPAGLAPLRRARPYLLYAGNRRPHKNLATLLAAWAALPAEHPLDLLLTGPDDLAPVPRRTGGEVVALGDLAPDALWSAYAGALAYVHPALREGFGLPLLEALRTGTPVLAADSAVPAVLRPHVRTFPATDVAVLRARLLELLADPAAARAEAAAGRSATAALTWERTAAHTAELYRRLMA